MTSIKIFCCRHGQDQDNVNSILNGHRDQPLTELGLQQASEVADKVASPSATADESAQLLSSNLRYIFHSPLQRAAITATTIRERCAKVRAAAAGRRRSPPSCEMMRDLIERDFGEMTGKPLADILKLEESTLVRSDKVVYFTAAAGSEAFPELQCRAARVLESVRAEVARREAERKAKSSNATNDEDDAVTGPVVALLVCHGDIMKMMVAVSKNLPWKEALMLPYVANTAVIEL